MGIINSMKLQEKAIKMAQHEIYNIRAGLPFSKSLAQYLLHITTDAPESLTRYRILLPTRRACRILRETFLSLNEGKPILLPQLSPLGDVDEDDLSLMMFGGRHGFLDIPEAIPPMKRQLLLAKLIRNVPDFVQGHDHALALSNALCRFIDQVVVEGLALSDLYKIVPDEFAAHWQITLDFLKIISEHWPTILAEHGQIDVAQRRNHLLHALADHWQESPPDYPVIAAGSTGSIPAAGRVLGVISKMPQGCVILPGLDEDMSDEGWSYITESHPQYSLKTMLTRIDATREDVRPLPLVMVGEGAKNRAPLASEMMLPAQVSAQWKNFNTRADIDAMLQGLRYYSCRTQQEEAALIALLMRETLEMPRNITALVTPDRGLARRVSAQCRRWGIEVDDSAGRNLADTRLGKLIHLSAKIGCGAYDPVSLLALLKISLCRFGLDDAHYQKMVAVLETKILRSDTIISSHDILLRHVAQDEKNNEVLAFLEAFYAAVLPLRHTAWKDGASFDGVLKAHIRVIENLAATPDQSGADILWRGDTGEAAALFLSDLMQHSALIDDVDAGEYETALMALMGAVSIRSAYGVHPRLLILGQLEARLSDADLVVLGGLNEGTWPPDAGHDPWMSRPMRNAFGLPGTDQAIGIAAHDFVQGFCARHVVMTRAEKVEGSPTVPARWLDRLDTLLQAGGRSLDELSDQKYYGWIDALDDHPEFMPYSRPSPCPPVSVRPKGASVTKIEQWIKDPYSIYMHYVLRLRKINPLVQDNDFALRGNMLHEILERFTSQYPLDLPDNAEDEFINIARNVLNEMLDTPDALRYWWPKCMKIAGWFVAHERNWRMDAKFFESEIKGNIDLDVDGLPFNLHGIADRIDRMHGGYAIIDYKIGGPFNKGALQKGALPQMPLEAVMLAQGGFNGRGFKGQELQQDKKHIPAGDTQYMGYWKMTGGAKAGEAINIADKLDETIEIVLEGLKELVRVFRCAQTPYLCQPDAQNTLRYNNYELVSRLKEWAVLDDMADEGDF